MEHNMIFQAIILHQYQCFVNNSKAINMKNNKIQHPEEFTII